MGSSEARRGEVERGRRQKAEKMKIGQMKAVVVVNGFVFERV